jgi:hypothetical protein
MMDNALGARRPGSLATPPIRRRRGSPKSRLKLLKSPDSWKEKLWILLPFPWNFLPISFENASPDLENTSTDPRGCYTIKNRKISTLVRR